MRTRRELRSETLAALAAELAGESFTPEQVAAHLETFEGVLRMIETLRELPFQEVEPAIVYRPVESRRRERP